MSNEVPIIKVAKPIGNGEIVEVDGVEYALASTAARIFGFDKSWMNKYARLGMPFARQSRSSHPAYPIKECREWIENYKREHDSCYHKGKIIVDGVIYYNAKTLGEASGRKESTISNWARLYGLKSIKKDGSRFFPLIESLKWIDEWEKAREKTDVPKLKRTDVVIRTFKPSATSICNHCDNAYANKCCWIRSFTPVEGWNAEPTRYEYGSSFCVFDCPNYAPDPPRKQMYY